MLKKFACITVVLTLIFSAVPAFAQDDGQGMHRIFRSTVYGGAIGLVAGFAFLLFTDNPEDHYDFLSAGAGVGILAGLGYGLATSSGRIAIAEVDNGTVKLNVPELRADIKENDRFNSKEVVTSVGLLNYRF
ncbi:MAG: hypothetical protein ACE5D4_06695 [Thermodesulfobacteriota bacterium]